MNAEPWVADESWWPQLLFNRSGLAHKSLHRVTFFVDAATLAS
jgi:hypothetical protein